MRLFSQERKIQKQERKQKRQEFNDYREMLNSYEKYLYFNQKNATEENRIAERNVAEKIVRERIRNAFYNYFVSGDAKSSNYINEIKEQVNILRSYYKKNDDSMKEFEQLIENIIKQEKIMAKLKKDDPQKYYKLESQKYPTKELLEDIKDLTDKQESLMMTRGELEDYLEKNNEYIKSRKRKLSKAYKIFICTSALLQLGVVGMIGLSQETKNIGVQTISEMLACEMGLIAFEFYIGGFFAGLTRRNLSSSIKRFDKSENLYNDFEEIINDKQKILEVKERMEESQCLTY